MADEVHYPDGARESDTPGYYGPADEKPAPPAQTYDLCWSEDPIEVCVRYVDGTKLLCAEEKLDGHRMFQVCLSPDRVQFCKRLNLGLVKGDVCLRVDFNDKYVRAWGVGCHKKWDTTWDCHPFNKVILRW